MDDEMDTGTVLANMAAIIEEAIKPSFCGSKHHPRHTTVKAVRNVLPRLLALRDELAGAYRAERAQEYDID